MYQSEAVKFLGTILGAIFMLATQSIAPAIKWVKM
jgi:hypothetical protein